MRFKRLAMSVFAAALAATTTAQTKISGTDQCKQDPASPVPIGDRPNHSFLIGKAQCTWPKPIEMAGVKVKEGASTLIAEINGDTEFDRGYYTGTMTNGDKFTARFSGTARSRDGKLQSSEGTWNFTGGTGKLKGLKGKGRYRGTPNADGTVTFQTDGEYSLP